MDWITKIADALIFDVMLPIPPMHRIVISVPLTLIPVQQYCVEYISVILYELSTKLVGMLERANLKFADGAKYTIPFIAVQLNARVEPEPACVAVSLIRSTCNVPVQTGLALGRYVLIAVAEVRYDESVLVRLELKT